MSAPLAVVEEMRDVLGVEQVGEVEVAVAAQVPVAGAQNDAHRADPVEEPRVAEVRQVFKVSKAGMIAGCAVQKGKIVRNFQCRVLRNGRKTVIFN